MASNSLQSRLLNHSLQIYENQRRKLANTAPATPFPLTSTDSNPSSTSRASTESNPSNISTTSSSSFGEPYIRPIVHITRSAPTSRSSSPQPQSNPSRISSFQSSRYSQPLLSGIPTSRNPPRTNLPKLQLPPVLQIIMAVPTQVALTTPMPTPGSPNAPLFRGERVTDFLDSLESHADAAKVPRGDLPGYVLRYCHRRVRDIIDTAEHWTQHDWPATRDYLIDLYASNDRKPRNSPDKLRRWVKIHADNRLFSKLQDVDRYY